MWLTCQACRALSFGQKLKELASHGMWLQLLRTSGLAFSGLTAAVSWGFIGTLRFKDIDGMLVFRVIMVLPSLGHHLPIGLLEISSLLPPSKDIPFLTLVAELHFSQALVRFAEKCGSFRYTEAGRLERVAGSGLTIALLSSLCDHEKTGSCWKSLRYYHNMRHFITAGYGYHILETSLPGHWTCHQTFTYHYRLPFIIMLAQSSTPRSGCGAIGSAPIFCQCRVTLFSDSWPVDMADPGTG